MVKRRRRKKRLDQWLKPDGTRLYSDEAIEKYKAARARLEAYAWGRPYVAPPAMKS